VSNSSSTTSLNWRTITKIVCLIALLVAANFLAHGLADTLSFQIRPSNEDAVHRTITASAVLYSILLALPFVPGAEVGLALMAVFGPPIAVLVYACTVAGLSLSFIAGRLLPLSVLVRLANDMRLDRTTRLFEDIEPLSRQERLEFLAKKAPSRLLPFVLRYRYIALAVALNIPGNFLIGGGGGIGLFAGISRLYTVPGYLLTIVIAVAPVPIAVLVFGAEFLSN